MDKGSALARFLQRAEVLDFLGVPSIDPERHVAVFGDAANDVAMFKAVGSAVPALRVGMPHATHHELCALSNVRAEVDEVLCRCVDARLAAGSISALLRRGVPLAEILVARWRAGWAAVAR